ncbi:MAG: hypothetical protein H6815_08065 [Phycisphaeraceae bacterium]|nr:hypothetical protein [Phycisphaerales bacterium]MCB9860395.1 hypothetical protein [Phycisphaeraceae bacterium]
MMAITDVRNQLLALERLHANDRDGGYGLAASLCDYRDSLDTESKGQWDHILIEWALDEAGDRWGIALEALARVKGGDVNAMLSKTLAECKGSKEWRSDITSTLLRRDVSDANVRSEVEREVREKDPMGLPNVARLMVVDTKTVDFAAQCLVDAILEEQQDYVSSYIPPFVWNAWNSNPRIIIDLVACAKMKSTTAGDILRSLFLTHLAEDYFQRELGYASVSNVVAELRSLV